jgi:hypothetical protein
MLRDPLVNLIRIDNAPHGYGPKDNYEFQTYIKDYLREEANDHAVRNYKDNNNGFVVIYMGSSKRIVELIDYLQKKPPRLSCFRNFKFVPNSDMNKP